MAYNIYATCEGTKFGLSKPDNLLSGKGPHKDKMEIVEFSWGITAPRDRATGQSSGKRFYDPVKLAMAPGAMAPILANACAVNEIIKRFTFEFYDNPGDGSGERLYFTITLEDVTVSSVHRSTGRAGPEGSELATGRPGQEGGDTAKHGEPDDTRELVHYELISAG